MEQPKNKNPGKVGHMGVAGGGAKPLFGTPDAKNKALEIEGKIEFGMKSVPTGEKSAGSIAFEGDKKAKEKEDGGIKKRPSFGFYH